MAAPGGTAEPRVDGATGPAPEVAEADIVVLARLNSPTFQATPAATARPSAPSTTTTATIRPTGAPRFGGGVWTTSTAGRGAIAGGGIGAGGAGRGGGGAAAALPLGTTTVGGPPGAGGGATTVAAADRGARTPGPGPGRAGG